MKLKITESAQTALLEQIENPENSALRITFNGYGWGGPRLGMVLDEPKESDEKVQEGSLTFVMEKGLAEKFKDINIDYRNSLFGKGFVINTGSGGSYC